MPRISFFDWLAHDARVILRCFKSGCFEPAGFESAGFQVCNPSVYIEGD